MPLGVSPSMGTAHNLQIGLGGPALSGHDSPPVASVASVASVDSVSVGGDDGVAAEGPAVLIVADEPPSFDAFYQEHRDRIGRALSLTVGDSDLGFEAVDEAMARAYSDWDAVGCFKNPQGWVYRTGLNWATSWLRRVKRARTKAPLLAEPSAGLSGHADVDLMAAVMELGEKHRAVVVLRYFCDMNVDETADALGIAPGTVKSRLSRALDSLGQHQLLAARYPDQQRDGQAAKGATA